MGGIKLPAFLAIFLAISLLALSANIILTKIEPRTEYGNSNTTGIMPMDRVSQEKISVFSDKAIISVQGLKWANFSSTGSMLPVLGTGAHALQIIPRNAYDVKVGDIISYNLDNKIIIHRVIELGEDEFGWYAITKGDNNPEPDQLPVRFFQIDRIVVGIIY